MEAATSPAGTARRVAIPGIRISAKTGTAQVASATGGYSDSDFIASLLGIFPTDDPRLIIYVVMQNPKGQSYYGSTIAAPYFPRRRAGARRHDGDTARRDQVGERAGGGRGDRFPDRWRSLRSCPTSGNAEEAASPASSAKGHLGFDQGQRICREAGPAARRACPAGMKITLVLK